MIWVYIPEGYDLLYRGGTLLSRPFLKNTPRKFYFFIFWLTFLPLDLNIIARVALDLVHADKNATNLNILGRNVG